MKLSVETKPNFLLTPSASVCPKTIKPDVGFIFHYICYYNFHMRLSGFPTGQDEIQILISNFLLQFEKFFPGGENIMQEISTWDKQYTADINAEQCPDCHPSFFLWIRYCFILQCILHKSRLPWKIPG